MSSQPPDAAKNRRSAAESSAAEPPTEERAGQAAAESAAPAEPPAEEPAGESGQEFVEQATEESVEEGPEEAEAPESQEVPRWATPAVPPPWAGAGQPLPGQPAPDEEGEAATTRKPRFDRRKWLPTGAVAAIIAVVVLGGIGLDTVLAAPTAGRVQLGKSVTMTAGSGWVRTEDQPKAGVELQKADVIVDAQAVTYAGGVSDALDEQEADLRDATAQISFGTEKDETVNGNEVAMVDFAAIVTGESGSGQIDGELICVTIQGRLAIVLAYAPQGDMTPAVDDVQKMVESIEVAR
jgi:hypothetical protein